MNIYGAGLPRRCATQEGPNAERKRKETNRREEREKRDKDGDDASAKAPILNETLGASNLSLDENYCTSRRTCGG